LNTEADALCDVICNEATGPITAQCNCALRESEVYALLIMGSKITSKMKGQLQSQLHDKLMRKYLIQREIWTYRQFEGIDWTSYGTAFKRMGRSRQTTITKACHNLCHTSMKHNQYYGDTRGCCLCGNAQEDWIHVISCRVLDADLKRADSWEQVKKAMTIWKLPPDFWTTAQKGIQFYIDNPDKRKLQEEDEPPITQAPAPFQHTLNNTRNLLRQAYRAQSDVGWDNFMKGRIVRQWETYIAFSIRQKQIGIPEKEWAAKLFNALWDHLHQIWTFMNGVLHQDNQGRMARYKVEALQRKIEVVWDRYNVLQGRMDTTLQGHFQQREIINNLRHDSKARWTTLAALYLDKTENKTAFDNPGMETFLVRCSGIG
jgi:hypothetical protein